MVPRARHRPRSIALLAGVLPGFLALGSGCGKCFFRQVVVDLPARFLRDGQDRGVILTGAVTDRNIERSQFDLIARVVSDASAATEAQGIVWTLDQGFGTGGAAFLAFDLSVPVARNQSLPVALASRFGGWGVRTGSPRPGSGVTVYFEQGGFVPASVAGTLVVRETAPLRMDVDLTFRDSAGTASVRIDGEMVLRSLSERVPCLE